MNITPTAHSAAAVATVIERVSRVYGSWRRDTPVAQMRQDWDNLFGSEDFPAQVDEFSVGNTRLAWVDPLDTQPGRVMLYFHGGGYRVGSVRSHRDMIARIAHGAKCRGLAVSYRCAPEFHYPAPLEDAVTAYQWLLAQGIAPNNIALGGDSAGGGIAIALLLKLRELGLPLPACAFTMSVWTDLTACGESYVTRAANDPIHQRKMIQTMAKGYLGDVDPKDPMVSPMFADLRGLPPLLLQVGDRETVLDDSRVFAEKAVQAGVAVELEVWLEMIHVFQQFTDVLPEALRAIDSIARFLRSHWAQ